MKQPKRRKYRQWTTSPSGFSENYLERNLKRWIRQYEAAKTKEIPAMDNLTQWLTDNMPPEPPATLVHGDYRLDNLVFDEKSPKVLAILDWELSTLGDPYTDLALCCFAHHLPSTFPLLSGFSDRLSELPQLGIPSINAMLEQYFKAMGCHPLPVKDWFYYMSFVFFRMASILQGVYKRSLQGQSANEKASFAGQLAEEMAKLGWAVAQGAGVDQSQSNGERASAVAW